MLLEERQENYLKDFLGQTTTMLFEGQDSYTVDCTLGQIITILLEEGQLHCRISTMLFEGQDNYTVCYFLG